MSAQLDTLQAMILAARAAGDDDTAAWLAGIADDPAEVAKVTGGDQPASGGANPVSS